MKDENASAVEQNNDTKPADSQNVEKDSAVKGNDTPNSVPYARFNEVNKSYNSLKEEVKALKQTQEDARVKQMEEQGKFKELNAELYTENKSLKEKLAYHNDLEMKERESMISQIPEKERHIYEELPTVKLREHIATYSSKKTVPTDKSAPIRKALDVKHDSDIWDKDKKDRQNSWGSILQHFQGNKN
tara:strand:- start:2470 stop:3033 length:564 start_codon:yes stop_codon:yes gene_type:complete